MSDNELDAIAGGKGGGGAGSVVWWVVQCGAKGFANLVDLIVKQITR